MNVLRTRKFSLWNVEMNFKEVGHEDYEKTGGLGKPQKCGFG